MKETKETYRLTLKKQTTCGAEWRKQQAALTTPAPDGSIPIKAMVSTVKKNGRYFLVTKVADLLEEKEVPFARIDAWLDEAGNPVPEEKQAEIANGKNIVTECTLDVADGTATLVFTFVPAEAVTTKKSGEVELIPELIDVIDRRSKEKGAKLTREDMELRAFKFIAGGIPQAFIVFILSVINVMRPSDPMPTEYIDPDQEKSIKAKEPTLIYRAVASFLMGYGKILKGPKSTGKNTFINWICWLMNVPSTEHTATMQDSRADYMASEVTDNTALETLRHMKVDLLAKKMVITVKALLMSVVNIITLGIVKMELSEEDKEALAQLFLYDLAKAEAASVHIVYEYAALAKWIMQGGVFILNECNMADANLLVGLLHPILDGSITSFPIPGVGDVPLGKNLVLYMTMNPGYAGETEMNEATKSRLGSYELAQPKSIRKILEKAVEHELSLYGVTTPLDSKCFEETVAFYDAINNIVNKGNQDLSDCALNIRGMVRAMSSYGRYLTAGLPGLTLRSFMRDEVVTPCSEEERLVLETILNATIHC